MNLFSLCSVVLYASYYNTISPVVQQVNWDGLWHTVVGQGKRERTNIMIFLRVPIVLRLRTLKALKKKMMFA